VVINDKPGEAGEEIHPGCQAANGPDGKNPIEQVERLASRTDSRSCVDYSTEKQVPVWVPGTLMWFLDHMTSPWLRLWFAGVAHRCLSVAKSGFFHFVSLLCRRIGSPPTDMMPEYVSQARFFLPSYVARCVLSSVWPPLNDARALIHVSAPAGAMQRQDWGFLASPRPGPDVAWSNSGRPTPATSHPSRPTNTQN